MALNVTKDQAKALGDELESFSKSLPPHERRALRDILVGAGLAISGADASVLSPSAGFGEIMVALSEVVAGHELSKAVRGASEQDGC